MSLTRREMFFALPVFPATLQRLAFAEIHQNIKFLAIEQVISPDIPQNTSSILGAIVNSEATDPLYYFYLSNELGRKLDDTPLPVEFTDIVTSYEYKDDLGSNIKLQIQSRYTGWRGITAHVNGELQVNGVFKIPDNFLHPSQPGSSFSVLACLSPDNQVSSARITATLKYQPGENQLTKIIESTFVKSGEERDVLKRKTVFAVKEGRFEVKSITDERQPFTQRDPIDVCEAVTDFQSNPEAEQSELHSILDALSQEYIENLGVTQILA